MWVLPTAQVWYPAFLNWVTKLGVPAGNSWRFVKEPLFIPYRPEAMAALDGEHRGAVQ